MSLSHVLLLFHLLFDPIPLPPSPKKATLYTHLFYFSNLFSGNKVVQFSFTKVHQG